MLAQRRKFAHFARVLVVAGLFSAASAILRAQQIPPGMVGEITGADVSVSGGVAANAAGAPANAVTGILVSDGAEVTVHSGQARMTLFTGGEIDLCGPAKFTPLQSGSAVTLALNFGQIHIHAPAEPSLRVFTPTIVASPMSISGGARDATFGLSLDDSLCVHAASGAIQLEDQFSGEKLIVPQDGDFFMDHGKLAPVAASPGSCACAAMPAGAIPEPSPALALETGAPSPASSPHGAAASQPPSGRSVLAEMNQSHPVAPQAAQGPDATAEPPAVSAPIYKISMPPLEFSASSPPPDSRPSPEMMALVRDARVSPQWDFHGRVEPPSIESAARQPHGFWHSLKRLFFL